MSGEKVTKSCICGVATPDKCVKTESTMAWVLRLLCLSIALVGAFVAARVEAQDDRVRALNAEAIDSYNNLEFDEALSKLQRAVKLGERNDVSAKVRALTFMNLGVVNVGGMGDNAAGREAFIKALALDPESKLDPLTSTPEIQAVFGLAKREAEASGASGGEGAGGSKGKIPHTPFEAQQTRTPIPVFVEVPSKAPVAAMTIFYRGPSMQEFAPVEMRRMETGFGGLIPCEHVQPPSVEYFLEAIDEDGDLLGRSGDEGNAHVVHVLSTLDGVPPSLPGEDPPLQCEDAECPPGMNCRDETEGALEGEYCTVTAECGPGMVCQEELCQWPADDDYDYAPLFVRLGVGLGSAFVSKGMLADGPPPGGADPEVWVPDGTGDCPDDPSAEDYCVGIDKTGLTQTFALRITAGYYLLDRLALAVTWRFQPSAGQGSFSNMLIGARGEYRFTDPAPTGFGFSGFLGTSWGQIQPQPNQLRVEEGPYVRSGLNGVQVGGVISYQIIRNFGLHVTPEVHLLFPAFLFNIDVTAGAVLAF